MEVILKQDVDNVGHKDQVVKVRDGFARNYLIPKGLADIATPSAKKMLAEIIKQRQYKEEKLRKEAETLVEKIKGLTLTVGAKTSTKGKIFGSVNNIQLAEALEKKGIHIDRKNITLKEDQIKEIGKYKARIKVYKDIQTDIEFEVVAE